MSWSPRRRFRRIHRGPGSLLHGRFVPTFLAIALVTLVPLALASPPDPTWIAGAYDDADRDDAVIAVTEASASPAKAAAAIVPARASGSAMAFVGPKRPSTPSRITLLDRSPPVS